MVSQSSANIRSIRKVTSLLTINQPEHNAEPEPGSAKGWISQAARPELQKETAAQRGGKARMKVRRLKVDADPNPKHSWRIKRGPDKTITELEVVRIAHHFVGQV